jgi:Na+-translocating ferredoxin:NAD+ oxidoreductase RnfC subunit
MQIGKIAEGQAVVSTPIGIYDHARSEAHFADAPLGSTLLAVLSMLKIPFENMLIRMGDYLRDVRGSLETVIGAGELTVHISTAENTEPAEPCIRCGWCRSICPTGVQPALILEANYQGDAKLAKRAGLHACIECGLCDYVCPSRLPLLESIRLARRQ